MNKKQRKLLLQNPDYSLVACRRAFRETSIWKQFRKALIQKQPHCSICNRASVKLQIHHLIHDWNFYADLTPENFQVVCGHCHDTLHQKGKNTNYDT